MTSTKQDKTAKPAAVELNDAALDRAVGGASTDPGGNTIYIATAGSGAWTTTDDAIRGDRDVKPRT